MATPRMKSWEYAAACIYWEWLTRRLNVTFSKSWTSPFNSPTPWTSFVAALRPMIMILTPAQLLNISWKWPCWITVSCASSLLSSPLPPSTLLEKFSERLPTGYYWCWFVNGRTLTIFSPTIWDSTLATTMSRKFLNWQWCWKKTCAKTKLNLPFTRSLLRRSSWEHLSSSLIGWKSKSLPKRPTFKWLPKIPCLER